MEIIEFTMATLNTYLTYYYCSTSIKFIIFSGYNWKFAKAQYFLYLAFRCFAFLFTKW